jgi:hypothetical protein
VAALLAMTMRSQIQFANAYQERDEVPASVFTEQTKNSKENSMVRFAGSMALLMFMVLPAWAQPVVSTPYSLPVFPREDSVQKDTDTGTDLLFLTNAKTKDTNLYFHQRSWLADGSMILLLSARDQGGLMGYIVETGELAQLTAADGAKLSNPTAALNRSSVFAMAGNRVVEIQLTIAVEEREGAKHAEVSARERALCVINGIDVYLNENCDSRYLAAGGANIEGAGKPGLVLINEETGAWERLCDMPDGVSYHGHVQWSISNPYWISFAGAPERLWVVDIRDRKPWCPYHQQKDELVTHESWWPNDQLVFCGGIHPKPNEDSHVKVIDMRHGTVRIVGEGSWWPNADDAEIARRNWWHASGSPDGRWMAGDNWHGDIMLFDGKTSRPKLLTTNHRTYGGGEHPEVGWDRKGKQVIFGSHKLGGVTVCVATVPEAWQKDLDTTRIGLEAK